MRTFFPDPQPRSRAEPKQILAFKALGVTVSLAAFLLLQVTPAASQFDAGKTLAGADVPTLIGTLLPNADMTGDVVLGIAARDRLAERARVNRALEAIGQGRL